MGAGASSGRRARSWEGRQLGTRERPLRRCGVERRQGYCGFDRVGMGEMVVSRCCGWLGVRGQDVLVQKSRRVRKSSRLTDASRRDPCPLDSTRQGAPALIVELCQLLCQLFNDMPGRLLLRSTKYIQARTNHVINQRLISGVSRTRQRLHNVFSLSHSRRLLRAPGLDWLPRHLSGSPVRYVLFGQTPSQTMPP